MKNSHIEWPDHTFNPVQWNKTPWICEACGGASDKQYDHSCTGKPEDASHTSNYQWHRARVFCASLADWLDEEVPIEWLADLLKLIHDTPNLDWLLLTKRPENWRARLIEAHAYLSTIACDEDNELVRLFISQWLVPTISTPHNIWIGTTVEDQQRADERIPALLKIPARVRFLSCEPLLGPLALTGHFQTRGLDRMWPSKIHWVICGGESGAGARPMHPEWARSLRDQCQAASVPFFFKQWGEWAPAKHRSRTPRSRSDTHLHAGPGRHTSQSDHDAREWNEVPK